MLKLTPLRLANVPPPMALHEIGLEHEVTDVTVDRSNTHVAVLHSTCVTILNYEPKTSATLDPVIERTEVLPISDFIVARQICYKGDDHLLVLMTNLLTNDNLIYDCLSQQESQVPDGVEVLQLSPSLDHEMLHLTTPAAIQQVESLENPNGYLELSTLTELPITAVWAEVVHCGDEVKFDIQLSDRPQLTIVIDNRVLTDCVRYTLSK